MSMVVQHNLQAMNSNRMLGITTSAQSKSTEKLSSGYKINRAADDAAGLTISEKMRKQMRGLDRASTNAQDGVSAVQTAEGALTEVHSMLQRMNELAVQASNGTNSESDRDAIQAEIDQLATEIDRVAETTKFNEMYLLKGDANGKTATKYVNAHDAGLQGTMEVGTGAEEGTSTFTLKGDLSAGSKINIAGVDYTIAEEAATNALAEGDDAPVSAADLATKLEEAAANGATGVTVTDKEGATTAYTYKAAEEVDETALQGKVQAAADAATSGTEIGIGDDTYTYHNIGVEMNGKTGNQLSIQALANSAGATGISSANDGDTVTVKKADGTTTTYTYDGVTDFAWKSEDGTQVALNTTALAEGDEVTVTLSGAETVFETIDNGGNGNTTAGFYKDNDLTQTAQTSAQLAALVTGTVDNATIGGNKITVGDKTEAGWYAGDGTALDPTKLGGATVEITNADGSKETVSVAEESAASGNTITKDEAITKIKDALKQASSIGVDDPDSVTVELANEGVEGQAEGDAAEIAFKITQGTINVAETLHFNLHVGADADMTNKIGVDIDTMNATFLGVKGLDVIGEGNDGGVAATYAIDAIADAISKVSSQRSALGAVQNRLEHTIANLDNVVENTTAAESRIRDTDMAEEMVEYSKNNILAQAGQSMLAQANQSTQGVLSLLG